MFENDFFPFTPDSQVACQRAAEAAVQLLREAWPTAYSGKSPTALSEILRDEPLKEAPRSARERPGAGERRSR